MYTDIQRIGELSGDGVFIFDLSTKSFNYLNDAFCDIFGMKKEQLIQQPRLVLPLIKSEDSYYLRHRAAELQAQRSLRSTEFRLQFENGVTRHLSCDAYLMDKDTTVAGFVKDISKDKEHEDYIVNYGAKKDTLLDMMSHNLSGPLHLTHNILQWLQTSKTDKSEDINLQLQLIQDNTKHCLDIINDFLRQEHLESERIYVKKTRFDVLEKLIATLEKLIASNRNKRFNLVTNLENLNINTDSVKFFQIVHNLISNAIKFTPAGGQIDILVEESEKTFLISVRDNGIGIPVHLQANLFDRRSPASRAGLNNELSSGLGLSIAKSLTELLGGKIFFKTAENKGTTFSIELPKD